MCAAAHTVDQLIFTYNFLLTGIVYHLRTRDVPQSGQRKGDAPNLQSLAKGRLCYVYVSICHCTCLICEVHNSEQYTASSALCCCSLTNAHLVNIYIALYDTLVQSVCVKFALLT
jgi:hypothetical protein